MSTSCRPITSHALFAATIFFEMMCSSDTGFQADNFTPEIDFKNCTATLILRNVSQSPRFAYPANESNDKYRLYAS
jgi:hypothetical protein